MGARADRVIAQMGEAEGDALAFAHGHIFRVIAARWIELPASGGSRLLLRAGAVSALWYERETQVLALWNQTPD